MNDNALYNPILFYLGANLISWGVIILIKNINIKNNIVHFLGRNSLIILVTHIPMSIVSVVKWKIPLTTNIYYIDCIIVFIVVMIIESILIAVINSRGKWLIKYPVEINKLKTKK